MNLVKVIYELEENAKILKEGISIMELLAASDQKSSQAILKNTRAFLQKLDLHLTNDPRGSETNLVGLQKFLRSWLSVQQLGLNGLMIAVRDGRIMVLPGRHEGLYKISDMETSKELLIASPYLITEVTRTYLAEEIEEFQDLLNSPSVSESRLHRFLEAHPKFLLGQSYEQLHSKVILERENDGPLVPDFVLQPYGNRTLCDIVDLKLPTERVIIDQRNRERFSSAIYEGAAQLRRYRDYFDDSPYRKAVLDRYGIRAYRPRLALVIGRLDQVDDEILQRQIENGIHDIEIITYDDLITRAKKFRLT